MNSASFMLRARQTEKDKDAQRIQRHREALSDWSDDARQCAVALTDKWQREALCSTIYIEAWRQLLDLSATQIYQRITAEDDFAAVLRRNSPILLSAKTDA